MSFARRRPVPDEEKCADAAKARAAAFDLLAGRELSSGQLYERLCRRYTEQAAAEAVAEMVEREYVDDDRYAETKAHSLLVARKSRRAAAQTLRRSGLTDVQIEHALDAAYAADGDADPELDTVCSLIDARYRQKLAAGRRDLVVAALLRRGFAYATVRRALEQTETAPE